MTGIYQITNKVNNRKYIGKSTDLTSRWGTHIKDLIKSRHCNKYLQNDWNKYGYINFCFEIVDICESQLLSELEDKYIKQLNPDEDYNIAGLKKENIVDVSTNKFTNNIIDEHIINEVNKRYGGYLPDRYNISRIFNITLYKTKIILKYLNDNNIVKKDNIGLKVVTKLGLEDVKNG